MAYKLSSFIYIFTVVIFSSVIASSYSSAVNYDDKSTLALDVTIRNDFSISVTGPQSSIQFINASMSAFPKSDQRQSVDDLRSVPQGQSADGLIYFVFEDPMQSTYDIEVTSRMKTANIIDEISTPVDFPIKGLDSSLYEYVMPTQTIDITQDIRDEASELIGNEDDLYVIEYNFAEYVRKNIAYDMGTLTADVNQKSSWVLANRKGVCDEITNLFISFNRAAGIPARFVSGISYTNLDEVFGSNWVPHAWAEVYFPQVGWVPYDVTYGQYGFIDAGHIKLLDSVESSGSDISYNYLGYNVKVMPGPLDVDVDVINYGPDARGRYTFDASLYEDEAGFGSYDLITVDVVNDKGYYQVADLYLAETQGMQIIEDSKETQLNRTIHRKQVLLRPYHTATIAWMIQIDGDLDKDYIYTLPITVYNTYNETSTTFLKSRKTYQTIDREFFDPMTADDGKSSLPYSRYIVLQCTKDKDFAYTADTVNIDCILDNQGTENLDSVNICVDGNCTSRSLSVQKVRLHYPMQFAEEGLKNIRIEASSDIPGREFYKTAFIPISVLDVPKLSIEEITAPSDVDYKDDFEISFTVTKESKSDPKNLSIEMISETSKVDWDFPVFDSDKGFTIKTSGSSMKPDKNTYHIIISYKDEKGNPYVETKDFVINSHATFLEKILLYLNLIGGSIEKMFVG